MYPTTAQSQQTSIYSEELNHLFMQNVPDAVTFVDIIIRECIKLNASDIFLEPQVTNLQVRTRIDGILYFLGSIDLSAYDAISSRIKVMSNLDPTEHRHIQEGQCSLNNNGERIDFRIEIAQTVNGEMIVIRILEKKNFLIQLSQLGLGEIGSKVYEQMLNKHSGLLLVCGPTGSGKTTTLYATINELNKNHRYNIMTIEDPVEYTFDGINQLQVNEANQFTFATGLKTILRLNPDIVLVGEIRDKETAQIAVESSLTGHLVLSTLHAADSIGALMRIHDLQIEPYILNSALIGIISQRLVRKLCQNCREVYTPSQDETELFIKTLGRAPKQLFTAKGCPNCGNLKYQGRVGIFELLPINQKLKELIRGKASEDEIRSYNLGEGYITLLKNGLEKCEQGITSLEEVITNSIII
jgi:type II secretory ATPase GspE/PulE/Tfp pilus assembly ATPase PilB-like protein